MSDEALYVLTEESYRAHEGEFPESQNFLDWVQARVADIPEEFRGDAIISLGSFIMHGEPVGYIQITYERPETAEERREREAQEASLLDNIEHRERAELARLKAKYEGAGE